MVERNDIEDYSVEGLVTAFLTGPKTLKLRSEIHGFMNELKTICDDYAERNGISDIFITNGINDLFNEMIENTWRFSKVRDD